MKLSDNILGQIREYTLREYPKELCGVVTDQEFIQLTNVSDTPEDSFFVRPEEYLQHVEKTKAIIHSHCQPSTHQAKYDLRTPSLSDLQGQRRTAKPWGIVGTEGETFLPPLWIPRTPSEELLGRRFIPYINDCYTLATDYHQFQLGQKLPEYAENFDWATYPETDASPLLESFLNHPAFQKIDSIEEAQNGDLLITDFRGRKCSHIAIFHNGEVIHQDYLSTKTHLSNFLGRIWSILRYVG